MRIYKVPYGILLSISIETSGMLVGETRRKHVLKPCRLNSRKYMASASYGNPTSELSQQATADYRSYLEVPGVPAQQRDLLLHLRATLVRARQAARGPECKRER